MAIVLKLEAPAKVGYDTAVAPRIDAETGERYYLASHPELPGCKADGRDVDEAIANLEEALRLYLEMASEANRVLPQPHPGPRLGITSASLPTPNNSTTGARALDVQPKWTGDWSPVPITAVRP